MINRSLTLALTLTLFGCQETEVDSTPDHWISTTNLKNATLVYLNQDQAKFIDANGNINDLKLFDSNGNALKDVYWNRSCHRGTDYLGMIDHWESGGEHLVFIDNQSGQLASIAQPRLINAPCYDDRRQRLNLHSSGDDYLFGYDPGKTSRIAIGKAQVVNNELQLTKVFETKEAFDSDFGRAGSSWFYLISLSTAYYEPLANELVIYSDNGDIVYQDDVTFAFQVNAAKPQFIVNKDSKFELVENIDGQWNSTEITTLKSLSDFKDHKTRPNLKLFQHEERSFLVTDLLHATQKELMIYEWANDELSLINKVEFDEWYDSHLYDDEIVSAIQKGDSFQIVSSNIDSGTIQMKEIEPEKVDWRRNIDFTDMGILYGKKVFDSDGISIKEYELNLISGLGDGVDNSTSKTIDRAVPNSYNDPHIFKFYLKYEFTQ
ncbi:hypothetical protein [Reinekea blandensis]|uniref:Uncharacterized protein n=1 Tax=Reinekea blandensis MED297 TaxID=314283 RepID=A4BCZ5_9GAMM|nr:hypothetical protein [Reinekea blandensis]EAR10077.1 hypothetical protein MED297_08311 [Reinekea sp. MED297] [Reinekea blandensis MED297]